MQLSNILCGGISMTELLISSHDGESTFIAVNMSGLALSCTMDWVLTKPFKGSGKCDAVANPCSLNLSALISDDELEVPSSAYMGDKDCVASFKFKLKFSGGSWVLNGILNLVTKLLVGSLEKEIT